MSASVRTVTPIVALTAVLASAPPTTRARTARTRSRAIRKPSRRTSVAPTTASSVFPTAIPAATASDASLVAFATKAPTAIAGQYRTPRMSSAASAIPDGAHTGVMTPRATGSSMPSLAAPT